MSARERAEALLERIARYDGAINAFVAVDREAVMRDAARVDAIAPEARGPLHGLAFGVKDIIDVAGYPTRAGSSFWSRDPEVDAPVVARLRAAGAFVIGKTVTHEWAWGITSENPHTGRVCNPWDLARIAGGSSGGSAAALAAEMCDLALGTDTLGSMRIPPNACNVTGIRPASGSVPMDGIWPLAPTLDIAGPMANDVSTVAAALSVMTGHDVTLSRHDVTLSLSKGDRPPNIARVRGGGWDTVTPHVARALDDAVAALRGLGAIVEDVAWWDDALVAATTMLQRYEAARVHEPFAGVDRNLYGADVRALLQSAATVSQADADAARATIATARHGFDLATAGYDALLAPVLGDEAPRAPSPREFRPDVIPRVVPASAFALPALALPIGFGPHGAPLGMQLIGTSAAPDAILALGLRYQEATSWHRRRPTLREAAPAQR